MSFAYPWVLAALFLLPLWWLYDKKRSKGQSIAYSHIPLLQKAAPGQRVWQHRLFFYLRLFTVLCLIIATARPQWGESKDIRMAEGLDIILVVDTSGSMRAMDFKIDGERRDRLFVVNKVMAEFVEKRIDDRIGLVVFGTEAFTMAPLTMDHEALKQFIDKIEIGMVGPSTAIGDGLALAVRRLHGVDSTSKVVILLTDGENNAGKVMPMEAAQAAKTLGIRVYTVGVGSNDPVPFPVETWLQTVYQNRIIALDEELLQEMADLTGGRYFLASDTQQLQDIYSVIDQLETREIEYERFTDWQEWAHWFLGAALLAFFAEALLGITAWRRIP